jgi:hypothetical protein
LVLKNEANRLALVLPLILKNEANQLALVLPLVLKIEANRLALVPPLVPPLFVIEFKKLRQRKELIAPLLELLSEARANMMMTI